MDVDQIVRDVANYDAIAGLIAQLGITTDVAEFFDISAGLTRVFGQLSKQGAMSSSTSRTEKKVSQWLHQQLNDFAEAEISQVRRQPDLSDVVASTLLKIVLIKGKYLNEDVRPSVYTLVELVNDNYKALQAAKSDFEKYDDLRVYLLEHVRTLDKVSPGLVDLLTSFEKVVKLDGDLNKIYANPAFLPFESRQAAQKYRATWQNAWLSLLPKLSLDQTKQALSVMHARIIPNFNRPHLLMDFLVDAYDHGGAVSLLSLNAVFVLIQHYQLDYPQFFTKLYELLEDGSILASAHRARFLRLLDLFLTSTHLPAAIPAAIIKRLARLCLFAPPGAIVAVLPFVYNQMQRHPTTMAMIHRTDAPDTDPFDFDEREPLLSHAIDSSLWELHSLVTHYHPNVAAIAKIYSQPFKKPQYQLEHFLSHSYETLYSTEYKRRRDREPGLEFEAFNVFDEMDWIPN